MLFLHDLPILEGLQQFEASSDLNPARRNEEPLKVSRDSTDSSYIMEDTTLRQVEQKMKVRVKTGCETCRIRRVKCDEAKPECNRCIRAGRKCEGYKHLSSIRHGTSSAASYRNPAFLVVPQQLGQLTTLNKTPSSSLSTISLENRSFHYFRVHTLPQWTEFFESELWSKTVLQLSHEEPAIKHGLLALSAMHERYERFSDVNSSEDSNFAFRQYMHAVKYSKEMLKAHALGRVDIEKVLIACIIFTCFENLVGNVKTAYMHLGSGVRMLRQNKIEAAQQTTNVRPINETVVNVLHRFDLQAMTFCPSEAGYEFRLEEAPDCLISPHSYTSSSEARNDLVELMRCMMWVSIMKEFHSGAVKHPSWIYLCSQLRPTLHQWNENFTKYMAEISSQGTMDPKEDSGLKLLSIFALLVRILMTVQIDETSEMLWDTAEEEFGMMVDIAETLPALQSDSPQAPSPSPPSRTPIPPAPNVEPLDIYTTSSVPTPIALGPVGKINCSLEGLSTSILSLQHNDTPRPMMRPGGPTPTAGRSFMPSFELSPIVPLFVTATRCRNPYIRRRAIALLLRRRRREGLWDSLGAALISVEWVKHEERLPSTVMADDLLKSCWLPYSPYVSTAADVPIENRIVNVNIQVGTTSPQDWKMHDSSGKTTYIKTDGRQWGELCELWPELWVDVNGWVCEQVKREDRPVRRTQSGT